MTQSDDHGDLPFGALLRARRLAAGLSLQALENRTFYSRGHLSKIENGVKRPTLELARLCDAALGSQGDLIRRVPSQRRRRAVSARRSELHPPSAGEHSTTVITEDLLLDEFRATFDQLRRLAQVAPPGVVLPALSHHGHSLVELAARAKAGLRDELYRLAARFFEHAGWMAQEQGDDANSIAWTNRAAEIAALGNEDLTGFRYVRRGDLAMCAGDGDRTIEWAILALRHAADARTKGLAAQRLAQGHAIVGNREACWQALDLAGEFLADQQLGSQPMLGSVTVVDHQAMARGWCLYDLAEPAEAANIMAAEVQRLPPYALRARARFGVRLARAHAAIGEIHQACAIAQPILRAVPTLGSATIRTEIMALDATLRRHRRHSAVIATLPLLAAARAA